MLHISIGLRNRTVFFAFISLTLFSCSSTAQVSNKGTIQRTTHFYNANGEPTFTHYLKIWYKDSVAIQEINGVNTVTDTANITTVTYPLLFCRYIDLRNKILYDYKTFSDTAKIIHKALLPDLMLDAGWSFYSENAYKIQGIPEPLSDAVIDNITYKRAKFNFALYDDPKKSFLIGYFRCDGKGDMFSLEKEYSRKLNCTMVKYFDYKVGMARPYASIEVDFLSDTLAKEELKIFDAWERNAKQNPVNK